MSAVLPVYRRSHITIVRGEGVCLYGQDGARYLDFAAGIAVNALGHCHPHVTRALKNQADTLWHCSNMYHMPGLTRLAARFTENCFAEKVFFCNSGGEAVECGIKMIRKYFSNSPSPLEGEGAAKQRVGGETSSGRANITPPPSLPPQGGEEKKHRYRIITMKGGFHGRTLACISAGGNEIARAGYAPLLEGFDVAEFNNISDVEQKITPRTAGILVEPVQGEGGIHVASHEFLKGLRRLCNKHGLLLMFDEVQCGMGRTGKLFAYEHAGITPDIVSTAKGIGNGFPLAACLMTNKVASCMTSGAHGSTYGSNPLAMAVGNAVLDVMLADGFMEHVKNIGDQLKAGLHGLAQRFPKLLTEVRGSGLLLGVRTSVPNLQMVEKLRAAMLLTSPAEDNVVRITPPLVIEEAHVEEALQIFGNVCEAWV